MSAVAQLATRRAITQAFNINYNEKLTALPARLTALSATYTRNTAKNVLQDGALVALANNQFGTSYDPVTGKYSFQCELAATNLATHSEGAAANWTVSNVVDGTTFFGRTNALYFGDNSSARSANKTVTLTSGTTYTVSVYVKMDDGLAPVVGTSNITGDFCLESQATIHSAAALIVDCGNGVYRVSSARAATATGATTCGISKATGQSARPFHITAIQVETGVKATSYILTGAGTATRNKDDLIVPMANVVGFTPSGYSMYAEVRQDTATGVACEIITVSDNTVNNRAILRYSTGSAGQTLTISGGVNDGSSLGSVAGVSFTKVCASLSANSLKISCNGGAVGTDSSMTMPVGTMTDINIGSAPNETVQFNGYIFRTQLIMKTLTDGELRALTA